VTRRASESRIALEHVLQQTEALPRTEAAKRKRNLGRLPRAPRISGHHSLG
jgi:hypothetical protein